VLLDVGRPRGQGTPDPLLRRLVTGEVLAPEREQLVAGALEHDLCRSSFDLKWS
jgi:hypothetical protein